MRGKRAELFSEICVPMDCGNRRPRSQPELQSPSLSAWKECLMKFAFLKRSAEAHVQHTSGAHGKNARRALTRVPVLLADRELLSTRLWRRIPNCCGRRWTQRRPRKAWFSRSVRDGLLRASMLDCRRQGRHSLSLLSSLPSDDQLFH